MPTEFSEGVAGRYSAEKSKLRAQQALRLKTAMAKLVGNYDHSDIILESSDGRHLPSHLCILKNRAPGFYKSYIEPYHPSGDGQFTVGTDDPMGESDRPSSAQRLPTSARATPVVRINDVDYNSLKFFLRCIYTAEEVPSHPTTCTDAIMTTSSMSSSGYDPTRDNNDDDNNDSTNHRVMTTSSDEPPVELQCQPEEQGDQQPKPPLDQSQSTMTGSGGSARLVTSIESHGSGRTYTLEEQESTEQTYSMASSLQSTPARSARIYASPERGTRALTVSAYSSMSDSAVEPLTKRYSIPYNNSGSPTLIEGTEATVTVGENSEMMTSFAELAVAANVKEGDDGGTAPSKPGISDSPESLALTTSMESAMSDDQHERGLDATYATGDFDGKGGTFPRRHRADHMIAKFIRVDGASSSSEQSPQQQQPPPADKKIFPMFIEMDNTRPSRLSLCEAEIVPLSVAAAGAVRRSGSGCTMDSPARSQMGRKRWSVTSLRSIDSADLASPLSSHGSVITGLDEEQADNGAEDGALQGACSRLGKDLVNMLMEGKDTDLTILANGAQLKAHRCILATSCPYFKAMLNGDWLESRNSVIELNGFSESTIMCALRLIYGGIVDVPENASVWELISFADMIQLDDLKQVAYLHIRGKYCHFFHKPCSGCVNGVLECLPYLHSYGVNELLERCRQWQAKYFARIWKTKMFNLLSEEILDMCYRSVLDSMTPANILDIMLGCEKLQLTLPKSRSAEAAGALVACLTDAALEYLSNNFDSIIESPGFTTLGKGYALNLSLFEDILPSVVHSLSPDTGCKSLVKLFELMTLIASQQQTGDEDWNDRFVNLLRRLYELCDTHLIHYASAVVKCDSWKLLTPDMQRRIQETGIFVDIRQPKAPPPRLSSFNRAYKRSSSSADRVRDRSVSIHRFRPPPPLTEYPSRSNVADTPTKSAPSPQTPASSQPKAIATDKKKHRRPSPTRSGSTATKKTPTAPGPEEKEKEVATSMKRSSTTDLMPGAIANPNAPVIDAQEPKTASKAEADGVDSKTIEALSGVENVMEVAPSEASDQGKNQSAADAKTAPGPAAVPLDENKAPAKEPTATTATSGHQGGAGAQARPAVKPKGPAVPAEGTPTKKMEQKPAPASALKQPQIVSVSKTGQQKKPAPRHEGEETVAMHRSPEVANLKAATEAVVTPVTKPAEAEIQPREVKAAVQAVPSPRTPRSTKKAAASSTPAVSSEVQRAEKTIGKPPAPQPASASTEPVPQVAIVEKREQKAEPQKPAVQEPKMDVDEPKPEATQPPSDTAEADRSDVIEADQPKSEAPAEAPVMEASVKEPEVEQESAAPPDGENGQERMETDENIPSDQSDEKAIRDRVPSSAAEKSKTGPKVALVTATVTPSTSPKKAAQNGSSKPTAKVAGIPKTSAPSASTATAPPSQQRPTTAGGSGTGATSARTPRSSHTTAAGATKPRASHVTHSPLRRPKTAAAHSTAKK